MTWCVCQSYAFEDHLLESGVEERQAQVVITMPLGVSKKGRKMVGIKKDRLLSLARNLSSTVRTLVKTARPSSDWRGNSLVPLANHVSLSRDERCENSEDGMIGNRQEVQIMGGRNFEEGPSYLMVLCSDESKMEIDAARPFLHYCFGQAGVVKIIFEELLRWFVPQELPAMIEALHDVFEVQGYDYPFLRGSTWTIGGPSWRLSASWCVTRRRLSCQRRTQDVLRYLLSEGERDLARKIRYLCDDAIVSDAFFTKCAGLICQAG